ncbi:MAG: hypothetical protein Q7S89_01050 [bacterium]|nr:hypothetical protein [bacterium]
MAGAIIIADDVFPMLDIRGEFRPDFWGAPVYASWVSEWMNPGGADDQIYYTYVEADYTGLDVVWLGVHTENLFYDDAPHYLSVGPNVVVPLGDHFSITFAHQFARNYTNQFWAFVTLDL